MKKVGIGVLGLLLVFTFSLSTWGANFVKIKDEACYQISFATLAFSPLSIYGRSIETLEKDLIVLKDSQQKYYFANTGYAFFEVAEEKCQEKKTDKLSEKL